MKEKYSIPTLSDGSVEAYAWPGGYPLFYITDDGGDLCPKCVQDNLQIVTESLPGDGWQVIGQDVNWEDPSLFCDHCEARIHSAYAEDRAEVLEGMARLDRGFMRPEIDFISESELSDCLEDPTSGPGIYARLSAPGYLDCTDWAGPFETVEDAEEYLVGTYDDGPESV